MADTVISPGTTVEEEISQEEEEIDNIHELMVTAVVTKELAAETEVGPKENDEQKPADIIVATRELAIKMEVY